MNLYFKSKKLQLVITLSFIVALTNCKQTKENEQTMETNNVLLSEWIGPYGGVPAFDKMNIEDIKSAFEFGMSEKLKEIDAIANK